MAGFGKHVVGILDLSDRIIQIYWKEDLMDVFLLKGLENEYFECEIGGDNFTFNLFKYKDEFKLKMYEMDGDLADYNNFDDVVINIE